MTLTLPRPVVLYEPGSLKLPAPPKLWRNKWWFVSGFFNLSQGAEYPAGESLGRKLHPSEDVARSRADAVIVYLKANEVPDWEFEYRGPVAVEGDS